MSAAGCLATKPSVLGWDGCTAQNETEGRAQEYSMNWEKEGERVNDGIVHMCTWVQSPQSHLGFMFQNVNGSSGQKQMYFSFLHFLAHLYVRILKEKESHNNKRTQGHRIKSYNTIMATAEWHLWFYHLQGFYCICQNLHPTRTDHLDTTQKLHTIPKPHMWVIAIKHYYYLILFST